MAAGTVVAQFTGVDHSPEPHAFVHFMDVANAVPGVRALKPVLNELLRLEAGASVLDLGCGTGDDARELRRIVGPAGRVVGVDVSETMIETARERSDREAVPVEFDVVDAFALHYPDDTFDACRAERVLMHVDGDPADAIAELVRVTRPGGRVAISDFDWDADVYDHPDVETTRAIVRAISDGIRNGQVGRRLERLLGGAGLGDVRVQGVGISQPFEFFRMVTAGNLADAERRGALPPGTGDAWWPALEAAAREGRFFAMKTAVLAAGTKVGY